MAGPAADPPGRALRGGELAARIRSATSTRAAELTAAGRTPRLAVVTATGDEASAWYVRSIENAAAKVGIACDVQRTSTTGGITAALTQLADDPEVHGVILQTPLPDGAGLAELATAIPVEKDVDGASPLSLGRLVAGLPTFAPATAEAVLALLDHYRVELRGRHAVVVGRSVVVGKPAAHLLLDRHATVTICHSRTADLAAVTRQADVLVAAAGRAALIGPGHVSPGATVIDIGTNAVPGGGLTGDVDPAVAAVAAALTPVPGGVGPVTTALLLRHVVEAAASVGLRRTQLGPCTTGCWAEDADGTGARGGTGGCPLVPMPGPAGMRIAGPGMGTCGTAPFSGAICSAPPPLLTLMERGAAGLTGTWTNSGPPSLSVVSAYGPPGTVRTALPPSVLTFTVRGAAANSSRALPPPVSAVTASGAVLKPMPASPPSVLTVAVTAATLTASSGPPPVSALSGPDRPFRVNGPFWVLTVSGPLTSAALTGPPPESRLASATPVAIIEPPMALTVSERLIPAACTSPPPETTFAAATPVTVTGPLSLTTVTATFSGTVMANPTLQSEFAQTGSVRLRRPRVTVAVTAGGLLSGGPNTIASVIWVRATGAPVISTGPP
jgi:methylenetetrahydrofolate dehydrogenase (NADP+)/methenyltetrahydrofolate cyclohydrolase